MQFFLFRWIYAISNNLLTWQVYSAFTSQHVKYSEKFKSDFQELVFSKLRSKLDFIENKT